MLIQIDEARSIIDGLKLAPAKAESMDVVSAVGKILSHDVYALMDTPSRDVSAMDGFAFRIDDLQREGRLRVVGKLYPFQKNPPELGKNEAYYVTTGAPIPIGADVVARIEYTRLDGDVLTVNGPVSKFKDIRFRGEDVKRGQLLIPKGTLLTPYHLAVLIQQGISEVEVVDVSFCIFGNGDEVVAWGDHGDGIPDSISPVFMKLLERFGTVHYQGVARDDLDDVKKVLSRCLGYDFIISIGGSSVGEKDFVKRAISDMGKLLFEGVSTNVIKRGGLGIILGKPVLVLPGQIVSAITSFHEHGLHLLSRMVGVELREFVRVRLGLSLQVDHKMDTTYLVRIEGDRAVPLRWGVGLYSELSKASGFTILKRGKSYVEGEEIIVQRFL